MIKLFTNTDLLIPENRKSVHPLLFDLHYFENAHPSISQYYTFTELPEDADAFIFPVNYFIIKQKGYENHYDSLYQLALSNHKKLIVYTGGDYGKTFNDQSIITWRNAGFKKTNNDQTVILPSLINDPLEREDVNFKILAYQEKPQISFTGFAVNSLKENLRITLSTLKANLKRRIGTDKTDKQSYYNAAFERYKCLKNLENNLQIETDFIYRDKYRAGAVTPEQREKSTIEFFENLNNSPYTFCLRGAGNFSVRFYEALACGRIPVLMDTDVHLPLKDLIDWDQHICRVLPHQNIVDRLLSFHKNLTAGAFENLQESNRRLYEDYLVRHAYFCKLYNSLKAML